MNRSEFFKSQADVSFENYFRMTHEDWHKGSLPSVRAILRDYVNDVKASQRQQNPAASRLKTEFSDAELSRLTQKTSEEGPGPKFYSNYNYISDNTFEQLNIISNSTSQDTGSPSVGQKRSREQAPEQPSTSAGEKRNCKPAINEDFVSSEVITDDDTNSNITSSPSSFYPSDLVDAPIGYTCKFEMRELGRNNQTSPLPIQNVQFARLVAAAKAECAEQKLFPTNNVTRLHASAIIKGNGSFLSDVDSDLPENVYKNIQAFKRAIQRRTLYIQPHPHVTLIEMAFNNIVSSTYLLHGVPRAKSQGSELSQISTSVSTFLCPLFCAHDPIQVAFDSTSWVFKQNDDVENESLRPDIIFHYQCQEEITEVGCGEVKKPGTSQVLLDKDKTRVLETMKRQLHLRLRRAKKEYEAATFGVLVQGTTVILLRMQLDVENGVYIYRQEQPFTLPTTFETHLNMDIALEIIAKFKEQMLDSLLKVEDQDSQSIWDKYKPHVRPTVSFFEPIYHR